MRTHNCEYLGAMSDRIERFVAPHNDVWDQVKSELAAGRKDTHWMWWIFPQLAALGRSWTAQEYGLAGATEAQAFAAHDVLGPRLIHACELLLAFPEDTEIDAVLGGIDTTKLRSSMTLFDAVTTDDIFGHVLDRYFDGDRDHRTLELLARPAE